MTNDGATRAAPTPTTLPFATWDDRPNRQHWTHAGCGGEIAFGPANRAAMPRGCRFAQCYACRCAWRRIRRPNGRLSAWQQGQQATATVWAPGYVWPEAPPLAATERKGKR